MSASRELGLSWVLEVGPAVLLPCNARPAAELAIGHGVVAKLLEGLTHREPLFPSPAPGHDPKRGPYQNRSVERRARPGVSGVEKLHQPQCTRLRGTLAMSSWHVMTCVGDEKGWSVDQPWGWFGLLFRCCCCRGWGYALWGSFRVGGGRNSRP